jgi:maltooligosyltrehalose trehalohydrolase
MNQHKRRLPVGAEVIDAGGVDFRVWAPRRRNVHVVFEDGELPPLQLSAEGNGRFSGQSRSARAGMRYRFRLDSDDMLYPDPVSRYQPDGVHGASEIIDPRGFQWSDGNWPGVGAEGQVLYEMHVGTFTPEGTWASAEKELPRLAKLGITCLEVMPVCEFAGNFGWGYDGVDLFAPTRLYGRPDDFRRFVDRAHSAGIGVILDAVCNHLGPDGNYLKAFAEDYFTGKYKTDWGEAMNFDGPNSGPVREFFLSNVAYWMSEFHVDGFRFDATQAIFDESPEHILAAISRRVREIGGERRTYLVNENEPQQTRLVRPAESGGYGMDALWNDDFHHSAMVALTGRNEAYYTDHLGKAQEFVSAAKWGYLFQGQRYTWQKKRRGTPALDLPPTAFVNFIQNHDQIANYGKGRRAHALTSPALFRAMSALLLLSPQTPMLFQGQEYAAPQTFNYFADHKPELARLVCAGRIREMSQFPSVASLPMQDCLPRPDDPAVFQRSKLDHADREKPAHAEVCRMHEDLLRLRREKPAFRRVQKRGDIDGAVLGPDAFVLRYFASMREEDRLLIVNFGRDLALLPAPEPLLAPPEGKAWEILWSSESPDYGGSGTAALETEEEGWLLPGRSAVVMKPARHGVRSRAGKAGN